MSRDYVLHPIARPESQRIDFAGDLNPEQLAAVTAPPGPALVLAGAGAGKTRALTYRVAYLLEQGVPPGSILLLTFTNKAAREMMRRVADLAPYDTQSLWGGTFHSIGNRVLRIHAQQLGYDRNFTILDREDAQDLLRTALEEIKAHATEARFPKADQLGDILSMARNTRTGIQKYLEEQEPELTPLSEPIEALAQNYQTRKREAGLMDFDDLLALWFQLLQEDADLREDYQRRFSFVLVDEYQDTNQLQCDLIDLLAARDHNVMAVGDDSQSIYSWRGARYQNILDFPKRHPGAQIYKITTNYRSTPEILSVANAAIAANANQLSKELRAVRPPGEKPALVICADANIQSRFISQRVLELREEGMNLREIAVLYRSHFHALELQLELTRAGIPFSITSGIRFFEQAHIKDLTAFLKLIFNPHDEVAFKRLVRMLPGIGPKAAEKLSQGLKEALTKGSAIPSPLPAPNDASSGEALISLNPSPQTEGTPPTPPPALSAGLAAVSKLVPKKAGADWQQFVATIEQLEAEKENPASGLIRLVLEAGYREYLHKTYTRSGFREDDLEQLAVFASQFGTLAEFLTQLALLTNLESEGEAASRDDTDRLRLFTIHQVKGLEFAAVFAIMLCEGLFPSQRSSETTEGIEEERRLFYVAITRAQSQLYLCYPMARGVGHSEGGFFQHSSRFVNEIPRDLLEEWNLHPYGREQEPY